jgi:hypothetical protein
MKVQIQLILSTLFLTALIWTYADQTSHETYVATQVPVRLIPPEFYILQVLDEAGGGDQVRADLTFRGPKSRIRALKADQHRLGFDVPVTQKLVRKDTSEINLVDHLTYHPEIRERGLQLQAVSPSSPIEFKVRRSVQIKLQLNAGYYEDELIAPATSEPKNVQAHVRPTDLGSDDTMPPLPVDLEDAIIGALAKPGQVADPLTLDIPLVGWSDIEEATFIPPRITVTVRLERQSIARQIGAVMLDYLVDGRGILEQYTVELTDEGELMQPVNVRGPQAKVEELEAKRKQIVVFVTIDDGDLPEGDDIERRVSKPVQFVLPPGFEDVEITNPERNVKLDVRRRKANGESTTLTPTR